LRTGSTSGRGSRSGRTAPAGKRRGSRDHRRDPRWFNFGARHGEFDSPPSPSRSNSLVVLDGALALARGLDRGRHGLEFEADLGECRAALREAEREVAVLDDVRLALLR
jgi:hypothetical protein